MTIKNLITALLLIATTTVAAAGRFISFDNQQGALPLKGATVAFADNENDGVKIAANNLLCDMEKVLGTKPTLVSTSDNPSILIGTIGHNNAIDRIAFKSLKGKREQFLITTRNGQLVIAGSDRRGTIYGIYELSRQLGVSPWEWWADVPVVKRSEAYAMPGEYTDGEPAVEFRGLFLNDEAPCLTSWVKNTYGTSYGDHRFYERVFELILRLRGNMLWPAMWGWAFYADDPDNSRTADRMGVIIGTSHHEPMGRNHQEYVRHRNEWGSWNYNTNQQRLDRFFREGIERMKGTEDIVTIGMRGDGDEAMSDEADTKLLTRIVENQRRIIKEVTGRPAEKTTQVWALYKEVMDYYDKGMRVPDDVIMLLCDDNWGNVRRVPSTERERKHKGGWGLYYHVDYVGAPRNTKWLNVTQTQQMAEQLLLAYDHGIQRMWILNVGDLKPMEYPIQLFMDMACHPHDYKVESIKNHTRQFFADALGDAVADEAADIFNTNCKYMARVTPEMLDAQTYNVQTGEWRRVADDYQRLELRARRLLDSIPSAARDAYRQLLLFPVEAMANLYDMYYAQAMNHQLAAQGNPEANRWAEQVARCFRRDSLLCHHYNNVMSGGKWRGMMTQKHIGYKSWNDDFPHDIMPVTQTIADDSYGGYTYAHSDGYVSMEAVHYYDCKAAAGAQWTVYPNYGRTLGAMALTPYTSQTADASLAYRLVLPDTVQSVKVHVVVKSTLDFLNRGGHTYTVSLDASEAQVVNFNANLVDRQPYMYSLFYPTIARRIVENVVTIPVQHTADGYHLLTLCPQVPGIVFEKVVVDYGGYQPSYLFGDETVCMRKK